MDVFLLSISYPFRTKKHCLSICFTVPDFIRTSCFSELLRNRDDILSQIVSHKMRSQQQNSKTVKYCNHTTRREIEIKPIPMCMVRHILRKEVANPIIIRQNKDTVCHLIVVMHSNTLRAQSSRFAAIWCRHRSWGQRMDAVVGSNVSNRASPRHPPRIGWK